MEVRCLVEVEVRGYSQRAGCPRLEVNANSLFLALGVPAFKDPKGTENSFQASLFFQQMTESYTFS